MKNNEQASCIVESYATSAKSAYEDYVDTLSHAGRTETGRIDPASVANGAIRSEIQRAAGKLGAQLAAASKRAIRDTLFAALETARREGADITPTVALHAAERVIGRGISMQAANKKFGKPGRTATHKSLIGEEDLAALEEAVKREIHALRKELNRIREHYRQHWIESSQRTKLISEWQAALGRGKPKSS